MVKEKMCKLSMERIEIHGKQNLIAHKKCYEFKLQCIKSTDLARTDNIVSCADIRSIHPASAMPYPKTNLPRINIEEL
jgi:hypothetical protein